MSIVDTQPDRSEAAPPRNLTLEVTPSGAFAAGALVVSALALAFALGRHGPRHTAAVTPASPSDIVSIEEVRRRTPISYHQLQVDSGEAR